MANTDNLVPFVKGDKRINRRGRPKTFDAMRTLAISIANEIAPDKNGNPAVVAIPALDGAGREHILTVAESILRSWANSRKPELQKAFVEIAFGKVPQQVDVKGDAAITLKVVYDRNEQAAE